MDPFLNADAIRYGAVEAARMRALGTETKQEHRTPRVGEPPVTLTWTTIAADEDGVVLTEAIGRRRETREAAFAWRAEADAWAAEQVDAGYTLDGISPYATRYHGDTDSPSNAWLARCYLKLLP